MDNNVRLIAVLVVMRNIMAGDNLGKSITIYEQ